MAPSRKKPVVKKEGIKVIGRVVTSRGQSVAESCGVLPVCWESLECIILLDVNHHLLTPIMLLYFFSPQRKCGMKEETFVFCTALSLRLSKGIFAPDKWVCLLYQVAFGHSLLHGSTPRLSHSHITLLPVHHVLYLFKSAL